MRFGVHLPLMDFADQGFAIYRLVHYVETATELGFDAIAANDHILFATPWLDGPTALAAVVSCSGDARLFTTVANPWYGVPPHSPRCWPDSMSCLAGV
jgi:alkanesulfonate monooxygenase SsuD/methylene tetrahydromethanopterin reductase-like flavin-dependent oxidoreductase (luciferase family)